MKIKVIITFIMLAGILGFLPTTTYGLSGSEFRAGRIIDDSTFYNSHSMDLNSIQAFLDSKVPVCDTNGTQMYNGQTRAAYSASRGYSPPFTCLKDYVQDTADKAAEAGLCNGYNGGSKSAAHIINDVAKACGINPKVLLVLLQKEQSLVTDDWPWSIQYRSATGYGCPDTAACDSTYYGFFNQVYMAARQFKRYARDAASYNYKAFRTNYIQFNPNASCGGSHIYIENQATASLYNYTPYQPNASALNNLYGTGDSCGAYGNRNFWRLFNDWFGSTLSNETYTPHPNGTLVSDGSRIMLVEDNARRYIATANVFLSHRFDWREVKPATTGDNFLPWTYALDTLAPGTIFTSGGPIYVMDYFGGELKKQHLSLHSYYILGYTSQDIMHIPQSEIDPIPTEPGYYVSERHPTGTVVLPYGVGKIYVMGQNDRRHIFSPLAFDSNRFRYPSIKGATSSDIITPEGAPLDVRQGTLLFSSGNIYVVDYDGDGVMKRPVGPWECFNDRWRYSWTDWFHEPAAVPARTGPLATC